MGRIMYIAMKFMTMYYENIVSIFFRNKRLGFDGLKEHSKGYLYAEALDGTIIIAIFILTITVMIGTAILQWRSAKQAQVIVQVAITAMEEGKYNYQRFGQLGELPLVQEPYKLVRVINSKQVHNMIVKELEVTGYYDNQEILHFSTYIWPGLLPNKEEE